MNIIDSLQWRYATKKFDKNRKLTSEQIEILKDAITLTPTSLGLQAFKVMVIDDDETKAKIFPHAYNQAQIVTSSHIFLFCAMKQIDNEYVDTHINRTAKANNRKVEDLSGYRQMVLGSIANRNDDQILNWNAKQTYIAAGNLLNTCALEKIDSCPMEGFSVADVSDVLGLDAQGLVPTVMIPVGYRSEDDKNQFLNKVRKTKDEVFI